ncbi:MAG TPA: D-glucuronyl C5-epimerase family protein [Thermoleophilaceae bacterium]|nr:D-glucuronyl C5-epimerase family protein [Thermoleophilaceae bacterium]
MENAGIPGTFQRAARELSNGYAAVAGRTVNFTHQPLGRHIDPEGLGGYYCDLRHKGRYALGVMDTVGRDEREWWIITVAQAALGFWDLRIEGHDVDGPFLRLADWLLERARPFPGGGVVWTVPRPQAKYGLAPDWASAMGQGQAASALLRAHALTGNEAYLEAARGALPPLATPVAAGGLQNELDGATVLEEYPTARPSAVLNGWIFALFGVHELATAARVPEARDLFERSSRGLLELLPRYDVGWWTLYSLHDHGRHDLAKPFYQRLHPVLLDALALIRPDPLLADYADRWRSQLTRPALVRASLDKLAFRLYRAATERRS